MFMMFSAVQNVELLALGMDSVLFASLEKA
jgi:hypothetical protein